MTIYEVEYKINGEKRVEANKTLAEAQKFVQTIQKYKKSLGLETVDIRVKK